MTELLSARPPLHAALDAPHWKRLPRFGLALVAAYALFMALQLSQHQMWRDELNAWGLVIASPTPAALFHNLHYEGHPGLWHLLLWCAARVSSDPSAMQVVHWLVATGVAAMIALVSPFSRLEKVLLLLNFYVAYEYAVISRNYGLGLLLALAYAHQRATRPDRMVANAALLGLLANTNLFGLILSGAFALEYLIDRAMRTQGGALAFLRASAVAMALYLVLVAVAVATMKPAADISWRTTGTPLSAPNDLYRLKTVLLAYWEMPLLPALYKLGWQPRSAGALRQLLDIPLLVLPFLVAGVVAFFRKQKNLLLIIGITAVGSALFGHLVYFGYMRHWGVNFVAVLAALWMQRVWRPQRSLLVVAFLAVGAATGVGASVRVWMLPFSHAATTARWIAAHQPADVALVGTADTVVAAVAVELHRPIYFLDCSCADTFLRYQRRRDAFDDTQIPSRLATAVRDIGERPTLLILSAPLDPRQGHQIDGLGIRLDPVARFTGSQVQEDFFLYRVARKSADR